ncbi:MULTISPECIES: hypothetical protein [Bacillus]|uniref:hypothetical protein n=1 Tax=Bacillus TaxID=1386 RepID=UPI0003E21E83|nr:hypothetical protein [Bacillus cereus]ETT72610.1 hypothetical protein C175_26726 [Bacillus cereus]OOR37593.1 hypothetical protein BW895_25970 [Bacillus cereus]
MKLYPIYEFPESLYDLLTILVNIEKMQPMQIIEVEKLLEKFVGKRSSRIKITVRNLRSLNIITGTDIIKLSYETQVYIDTNSELSELLLLLVYNEDGLFKQCKDICNIGNFDTLNNIALAHALWKQGYTEEKINTAKEKIYALKRLINCCYNNKNTDINIFVEYESYMNFIEDLQEEYLNIATIGDAVAITDIRNKMQKSKGYSLHQFNNFLSRLFDDPIHSKFIAFTTVNDDFAHKGYFNIHMKNYYYIKLLERILYKDTLL